MNNYVVTHLHTMLSNGTTNIDSVTKFEMYIEKASKCNMKAIAFTEHGNIFEWIKKKQACDEAGLKYIHGVEAYVTETLTEKKRDNYHTCLYARNYKGFLELNKLISNANNRADGHFYYVPRITIDELLNTSNNILISTACLGGILSNGTEEIKSNILNFLIKNKNRCFLEIQHHNVDSQKSYNKFLFELSKEYNIPLITGTDTHSLNSDLAEGRIILQKSKKIYFDNEDGWDLTFKTYDELVEAFKIQNSLPMEVIIEAIDNTNKLSEMIESFELDKSHKYPHLWNNPLKEFQNKIKEGYIKKGINKLSKDKQKEIKQRINEELKVYKQTDSIDYMLFMKDVVDYAHSNNMYQGYGRGSVNGSYIAYLLDITDMDSIKYNLNFFRFMNPHRISLCDIDTDWSNIDRDKIKEYLFNYKGIYASEIITFNTIAKKGAIRDVGRALEIPLTIVDEITKNIETKENEYRSKYPELFKYVDLLNGVVVSIGTHPSGVLISPIPIDENLGLCSVKECENPVSMVMMKELDSLNYVKFDILGLDNIDIINKTCKLANIERIVPDNLDVSDENVWKSIRENTVSIFQWESDSAQDYIKRLFSDKTIEKIKNENDKITFLDLFSFGNGAIRPSGESFRDLAANGEFKDNQLKELNEFLVDTMGYLTYQEQIMMFLVKFCGYSMAESDTVRRGIAKKGGTEKLTPEIKQRFIETATKEYNINEEKAIKIVESFIQVILDASSYGFSLNHSSPYSLIGYACGWLRFYYPLEFITSAMNVYKDKMDKIVRITDYAKQINIPIKPIQFRYSRAEYMCDKKTNSIYKGISSIKFMNEQVAEELYELRNNKYSNFIEVLNDLSTKVSCNSRQLDILIKLNFFKEFGNNQCLLNQVEIFNLFNGKKQIKKDKIKELKFNPDIIERNSTMTEKTYTKLNTENIIKELCILIPNKSLNIKEQIESEIEYYGYAVTKIDKSPSSVYIVTNINDKYTPKISFYNLKTGNVDVYKCTKADMKKNIFVLYSIIKINKIIERFKKKKVDNEWITTDEKELYLKDWEVLK